MTMMKIGIILIIFVTLGMSLIYGVLDPLAQQCYEDKKVGKVLVCPRYVDLGVSLILIISAIISLFGAFNLNLHCPDASLYTSKTPALISSIGGPGSNF